MPSTSIVAQDPSPRSCHLVERGSSFSLQLELDCHPRGLALRALLCSSSGACLLAAPAERRLFPQLLVSWRFPPQSPDRDWKLRVVARARNQRSLYDLVRCAGWFFIINQEVIQQFFNITTLHRYKPVILRWIGHFLCSFSP